jgi:hypothetical protein
MPGVVKLGPVPNDEPPVAALYQLIVPALAVAPRSTVPEPQTEPGVVPEMVGMGLIIIRTLPDVAVEEVIHVALLVICTDIFSPSVKEEEV